MNTENIIQSSPSSVQAQHQTATSLETTLHFAIKGEETLWRECERLKSEREKYETLCEAWRKQNKVCKETMRLIKSLNPGFNHPAFEENFGCLIFKPYKVRESEGVLTHQLT